MAASASATAVRKTPAYVPLLFLGLAVLSAQVRSICHMLYMRSNTHLVKFLIFSRFSFF